jgi:hypothetical protein
MKLGMSLNVNPRDDSDHAMHRYLAVAVDSGHFLGILTSDEDSITCVQRMWRLSGFDQEVVEACAAAWLCTGKAIAEVIRWMGAEPPPLSLDCRHAEQKVQFKLYDRGELRAQLRSLGGKP